MNSQAVIRVALSTSQFILTNYLSDFSDSDLLVRPVENANHVAWQLGHLIISENQSLEFLNPEIIIDLPDGFLEVHSREMQLENRPEKFYTKLVYLELYNKQRNLLMEILDRFDDDQLDAPGPEKMRAYAPTIGHVFIMSATHDMMHAGQFAVVRRKLGKPIII